MAFLIDQAVIPLGQLLLIAAGAALTAPIGSLFYVILAENKVQGFALAKFVGIVGWLILLGWFVPEPWQWLFGLFPPFLISKAYWMAFEGRAWWWVALLAGVVLQAGVIAVLVQRFHRVVYR
jgi:fluoroquinolone transport system permease protein